MFDISMHVSEAKRRLSDLIDVQWRTLAGLAFMALAMAAIEYDEFIAPGVNRLSDGWSSVATDFGRRFTGFAP